MPEACGWLASLLQWPKTVRPGCIPFLVPLALFTFFGRAAHNRSCVNYRTLAELLRRCCARLFLALLSIGCCPPSLPSFPVVSARTSVGDPLTVLLENPIAIPC